MPTGFSSRVAAAPRVAGFVLVGIGGHGASRQDDSGPPDSGAEIVSTDEFWNGPSFDLHVFAARSSTRSGRCGPPASRASTGPRRHPRRDPHGASRRASSSSKASVRCTGCSVTTTTCASGSRRRADVRLARGVARDGEEARATWEEVWMPMEDRYVERDDPVAAADLIVDGTA